jgi:cadmium resistance protein CadD (predicted permease)
MAGIGGTIVTAAGMFAAVNIDDAIVLATFNIAHRSGGAPTRTAIWLGQFIGMGLIVVVALLAALGLSFVPLKWVGLLGAIPLARGIALLVSAIWSRDGEGNGPVLATGLGSVIALTFANGGDNIALWTAAFRVMAPADTALTIVVFAVAVALWCTGAELLISHHKLVNLLKAAGRWLAPAVLTALGVYIVVRSGLLAGLV